MEKLDGYGVTISIRSDPSSIPFYQLPVSGSWAIKTKSPDVGPCDFFFVRFLFTLVCDVSFIPVPFTTVQLCFLLFTCPQLPLTCISFLLFF